MNNKIYDQIIQDIREDQPASGVAEQASARVRAGVFGPGAAANESHALKGCAGYQGLIPDYLGGRLPAARALLFEDHTHECVACRRALETARTGKVRTLPRPVAAQKPIPYQLKYAVAAVLAIGVGLASWGLVRALLPTPGVRASVQNVNGNLYAVSDRGSMPVFSGHEIGDRQRVRTAKGSTAVLRLADGSLAELNERSEMYVTGESRGATIHLTWGNVIVQAAKQKRGTLDVSTGDCVVSVKGTIFAVTRGIKGSRVSVVEGVVKVAAHAANSELHPGDQVTTDASLAKISVADDIGWSRNSAQYLALLGELSTFQQQVEAIPAPGLRYSSKLVDLVPAGTVVYAAIPNIGGTLSEADRLFEDRLRQSEVLRDWWAQHQPAAGQPSLSEIVQKIRAFSDYLGDEIVLSVSMDVNGNHTPVLLAEATRPGLREFLEAQFRQLNANGPRLQIVDDPSAITDTANSLFVLIRNNVVAVTPQAALAREVAGILDGGASGRPEHFRLYPRVMQSYRAGAGWLLAADLEQISPNFVNRRQMHRAQTPHAAAITGFQDLGSLVFERRETAGRTENQAALSFTRERRGIASWLGAPGPMGSLDFISPDASVAASFSLKSPRMLLADLMDTTGLDPAAAQEGGSAHSPLDFRILNDLANALGSDVTIAIDGGLLPVPSWVVAIEVYNPGSLQIAIEQAITSLNGRPGAPVKLTLSQEQVNGRTYYTIHTDRSSLEAHYTYVDSYLLAAANRNLLDKAIQNRATGYALAHSKNFREQLPVDGRANFSGILYHNLGPLVGPLADQLRAANALTPAQKASIQALQANSGPGLVYAYGEPDRIVAASMGSFLGLKIDTLALPQIFASALGGQNLEHLTQQHLTQQHATQQ